MTAPITDEAWQQIVNGLEGVTPGPWAWESHGRDDTFGVGLLLDENDQPQSGRQPSGLMVVADPVAIEVASAPAAAHIARMSPDTIRAIAARIASEKARADRAEAENKRLRDVLQNLLSLNDNHGPFGGEIYQDRIDRAWDRARAALEARQ